jgi:NAD(P)-dependent dehydrogenase (short-subunit alcohol dehydrogenase family)
MLRDFVRRPDATNDVGVPMDQLIINRAKKAPMGRISDPMEIANLALFLVSDEASWVSGAAIPVDGASIA